MVYRVSPVVESPHAGVYASRLAIAAWAYISGLSCSPAAVRYGQANISGGNPMVVQHQVNEVVLSQDRFEKVEVKKDDDSFVIISRWLSEGPEKATVIILNFAESRELVRFFERYLS